MTNIHNNPHAANSSGRLDFSSAHPSRHAARKALQPQHSGREGRRPTS
jgi:hypothetical protein